GERGAVSHTEPPDMPRLAVGDVELPLIQGERQAVGPDEAVGGEVYLTRARVDPVHVMTADLALGLVPLVIAVDAIARIGEPDRAVRTFHDVVRAIQPQAVEAGR